MSITPSWTRPESKKAATAYALVTGLQHRFRDGLEAVAKKRGDGSALDNVTWERDEGRHGGGNRFVAVETPVFNRAAINVSQVHYDDLPDKKLASATAISTIIHPTDPRAPSVHMHFSFTERRDGTSYWRLMADLNPSLLNDAGTARYKTMLHDALGDVAGPWFASGIAQGDVYFDIPALGRTRGVFHFYLEAHEGGEGFDADLAFTQTVAERAIDTYVAILDMATDHATAASETQRNEQVAYHTAYLFQVLTLDRGTTSGLLVHNQNDVGIMGSLPAYVDATLLASWRTQVTAPQDTLVDALVDALGGPGRRHVTADVRAKLADAVRAHYRNHPEALGMQAAGKVAVPTVQNHGSSSAS